MLKNAKKFRDRLTRSHLHMKGYIFLSSSRPFPAGLSVRSNSRVLRKRIYSTYTRRTKTKKYVPPKQNSYVCTRYIQCPQEILSTRLHPTQSIPKGNPCVLVVMLGDEGRDLGLSDNAVVESDEVGVGVRDDGGDTLQNAVFQVLHPVRDRDVSYGHHLVVRAF